MKVMNPSGENGDGKAGSWFADYTNPNGTLVKNEQGELAFVPRRLPPTMDFDAGLLQVQIEAERKVAELGGMLPLLPSRGLLVRACVNREAVLSSRIEGVDSTLREVNVSEAVGGMPGPASGKAGLQEVVSCAKAMDQALEKMPTSESRLDMGVILQAHGTLMGAAGSGATRPGQLRTAQNYIVRLSGRSRQVRYVPPPHGCVRPMLEDMTEFLRKTPDGRMSGLVQCAVAHYQFEAIHPFPDGNGRVGRLLMPAVLRLKGILHDPLLCLSAYFERHREEYYARLRGVSQRQEWREWLWFFFEAVIDQADERIRTVKELKKLRARYEEVLSKEKAGSNAKMVLELLFANPYTTVPRACQVLGMTYPAGKRAIGALVDAGILRQARAKYRGKVFYAEEIDAVIGKD